MSLTWRIFLLGAVILTGFARAAIAEEPTLVDDKYSLKADREALDKLRKDIPAERQKENDEKAFMDQMMSDLSKSPSEVRSRFSSILNKKREVFNKDMTKVRQDFNKVQTKDREEFTKKAGEERKVFSRKKASTEDRKSFFEDQESRRKDFYENQKSKRDEFEADMRDKRKNFDDYMRAKTDEFNQLHRDYSSRYQENKKALEDQKKQAALKKKDLQKNIDKEYEAIKGQPATQLEVEQPQQQGQ